MLRVGTRLAVVWVNGGPNLTEIIEHRNEAEARHFEQRIRDTRKRYLFGDFRPGARVRFKDLPGGTWRVLDADAEGSSFTLVLFQAAKAPGALGGYSPARTVRGVEVSRLEPERP